MVAVLDSVPSNRLPPIGALNMNANAKPQISQPPNGFKMS